MATPHDDAPPAHEPLRVSISRARTFRQCPRRGYFEHELGRRPSNAPHEQVWGAALHRGLEVWFAGMQSHLAPSEKREPADVLADAIHAAIYPGHDAEGRPYAPPADPYARAALRAMLRAYAAVWGESDAARYEVVAVELPFDLPVLTPKGRESRNGWGRSKAPRRVGRVDAVVRERGQACEPCGGEPNGSADHCPACLSTGWIPGRVWTVEHKTTGKVPDEHYYKGIEVDPQIATYHDALTIMGYAPAGVLYDVVRRPDYHEPKPAPAMKRCPDCKGSGYVHHAPCSIPECDHEDACPTCQGSGKVPKAARKVECGECQGEGRIVCARCVGSGFSGHGTGYDDVCSECGGLREHPCDPCSGKGRITPTVSYSNPRHGERAADYEERIYQLATSRPGEWFGRREFRAGEGPLTSARIQEARLQLWSAAREIRAYQRAGVWPEVGDRYVCAPPGRRPVCPWLDVCAGRARADDDRLYPLKTGRTTTEGDE